MIVKWIVCKVDEERRGAFSRAQEMWRELTGVDGFLGQVGGWEIRDPHLACIAGFWRDRKSYDRFMSDRHDAIFKQSRQEETYRSIRVSLSSRILDMPGCAKTFRQALRDARLLRVAECTVHPGREEHFLRSQETVWLPAMRKADGMLGGVFTLDVKSTKLYRVLTLWTDESSHRHWSDTQVRRLTEQAGTGNDAENITGRAVLLEPGWRVVAESGTPRIKPGAC
jgi:heme-degrading monooxygenase HmoA